MLKTQRAFSQNSQEVLLKTHRRLCSKLEGGYAQNSQEIALKLKEAMLKTQRRLRSKLNGGYAPNSKEIRLETQTRLRSQSPKQTMLKTQKGICLKLKGNNAQNSNEILLKTQKGLLRHPLKNEERFCCSCQNEKQLKCSLQNEKSSVVHEGRTNNSDFNEHQVSSSITKRRTLACAPGNETDFYFIRCCSFENERQFCYSLKNEEEF